MWRVAHRRGLQSAAEPPPRSGNPAFRCCVLRCVPRCLGLQLVDLERGPTCGERWLLRKSLESQQRRGYVHGLGRRHGRSTAASAGASATSAWAGATASSWPGTWATATGTATPATPATWLMHHRLRLLSQRPVRTSWKACGHRLHLLQRLDDARGRCSGLWPLRHPAREAFARWFSTWNVRPHAASGVLGRHSNLLGGRQTVSPLR